MKKPSCNDLYNGEGFTTVRRDSDDSWRHGSYVYQVFHHTESNTYWAASYRLSTDGEVNELAEGVAFIDQVRPVEKIVIDYEKVNTDKL